MAPRLSEKCQRLQDSKRSQKRQQRQVATLSLLDVHSLTWPKVTAISWRDGSATIATVDPENPWIDVYGKDRATFMFWGDERVAYRVLSDSAPTPNALVVVTPNELAVKLSFLGVDAGRTKLLIYTDSGRTWKPLIEQPALFRRFADLDASTAAFAEFCRAHGPLGIPWPIATQHEYTKREIWRGQTGERFEDWRQAHTDLRLAVRVWNALRGDPTDFPDQDFLRELLDAERRLDPVFGERKSTNDPKLFWASVRNLLTTVVNQHLAGTVNLIRTRVRDHQLPQDTTAVHVAMRSGIEHGIPAHAVQLRPPSLLSAMWLQLANAMQEGQTFERCSYCRKWFLQTRTDRLLCSRSCRNMASRKKLKEANNGTT